MKIITPMTKSAKTVYVAAALGAAAALFFAITWFRAVAGNCGVVRFYEQLYGIFVLACWLIVTIYGIWFTGKTDRIKSRLRGLGTGLVIAACVGMVLISVKTLYDIRKMNVPAAPPVLQSEPEK